MKFGASFLLHAGLGFVLTMFFPWWSVVILAFIIGFLLKVEGWQAFLAGFVGMMGLWMGYATFMDYQNGAILSEKVAQLFQLSQSNYLIYITGFIGGLLGGMGALTGRYFRDVIMPEKGRYGTRRRRSRYSLKIAEE
ncbi:MAG: hypothetical protein AB8G11_21145 [Saprospiraceae bacterium]